MDIRPIEAEPTADERAAVDAVLGAPESAWEGGTRGSVRDAHTAFVGGEDTRARRHELLPALQALQARVGWISEGGLGYVCDRFHELQQLPEHYFNQPNEFCLPAEHEIQPILERWAGFKPPFPGVASLRSRSALWARS